MITLDGKRVAGYVRVSTEDQAKHGLSVDTQRADLKDWAVRNNIVFTDMYIDAGFSARKKYNTRPEMVRLLQDVSAGKIDVIVFTKLDRWFRNVPEYYKVQEVLEAHNCIWTTIYEDYETETASGRFKVNIMLSVAQDEADRTSERIKVVMARKRERGELTCGAVPYGYRKVGKFVEIDPVAEPVMRLFFSAMLRTNSVGRTLAEVHEKTGVKISRALAYRMRKLESYAGNYHGISIPPYITWEEHLRLLAGINAAPKMVPTGSHTFLFSGLMYCGECGSRMPAHAQPHRHMETVDYQCRRYAYHGPCNNKACILERVVEAHLLENLEGLILNRNSGGKRESIDAEYAALVSDREDLRKRLSRLKDLYLDEVIDIEDYKTEYYGMTQRIEGINNRITALEARPQETITAIKLADDWAEIYADLDREHRADFWRSIVKRIKVYSNRAIIVELL